MTTKVVLESLQTPLLLSSLFKMGMDQTKIHTLFLVEDREIFILMHIFGISVLDIVDQRAATFSQTVHMLLSASAMVRLKKPMTFSTLVGPVSK